MILRRKNRLGIHCRAYSVFGKMINFKVVEFDHFRMSAGLSSFVLSASEWIERTNAIGIIVKKGRYGGTYAHKDIAFEFGLQVSILESDNNDRKLLK